VGGNIPCFWKPVAKGFNNAALGKSKKEQDLDHLIAGCVTTAAQFPSISADPTLSMGLGRPLSLGSLSPFEVHQMEGGPVGVAVTLWQRCPWSSLGRNLRSKTR
jgi:hypothetical protein